MSTKTTKPVTKLMFLGHPVAPKPRPQDSPLDPLKTLPDPLAAQMPLIEWNRGLGNKTNLISKRNPSAKSQTTLERNRCIIHNCFYQIRFFFKVNFVFLPKLLKIRGGGMRRITVSFIILTALQCTCIFDLNKDKELWN